MAIGRIPGPFESLLSLAGRVVNKPGPLGRNPQPPALASKRRVTPPKPKPPPPPVQNVPFIRRAMLNVTIEKGLPTGRFVYDFKISGTNGDAFISVDFQGSVQVPSAGVWEIGLVQNLEAMQYEERYMSGGKIAFFLGGPLLDRADDETDFWFTSKQVGFIAVTRLTSPSPNFVFTNLSLSINDVTDNPGIMAQRTRCRDTIAENLDFAKKSMFFRAAVFARKGSDIFQLAATEPYGFSWLFDVPAGGGVTDPSWLTFDVMIPSKTNLGVGKFKALEITGARPNALMKIKRRQALLDYDQDCSTKSNP